MILWRVPMSDLAPPPDPRSKLDPPGYDAAMAKEAPVGLHCGAAILLVILQIMLHDFVTFVATAVRLLRRVEAQRSQEDVQKAEGRFKENFQHVCRVMYAMVALHGNMHARVLSRHIQ